MKYYNQHVLTCMKPTRVIATLAGIQVIRSLWEVWDAIDNKRPGCIHDLFLPMVYITCILGVLLMITSVTATWTAYNARIRTLNVCWWIFYLLTLGCFINDCTKLSIISLSKEEFVPGCMLENATEYLHSCGKGNNDDLIVVATEANEHGVDPGQCQKTKPLPSIDDCEQLWRQSVIWIAIKTMLDLVINIGFAYALYRFRVRNRNEDHPIDNHVEPATAYSPSLHKPDAKHHISEQ